MIRSKLTAARREINAKDTLIKKLQKENQVLKYGSSQSEVKRMRRLLAVIRSKFRKFKISHRHLVHRAAKPLLLPGTSCTHNQHMPSY